MEMLQFDFMRRAIFAGLIIGISCPLIGIFLVARRQSLIGDGLGHIAFAGVAAGWLLGWQPVLSAALFTVLGAVGIEKLRTWRSQFGDMALAIFFYSGMALAVVLTSMNKGGNFNLVSFLFGSIVTVTASDLIIVGVINMVVVLIIMAYYRQFFYLVFDEQSAAVSGLPVHKLNLLLSVITALTVAVSMRIVGLLLVSALMIIPVACALQIARGFFATMLAAVGYAVVSVLAGITISFYANFAPGGTIVLSTVMLFILTCTIQQAWYRGQRLYRTAVTGRVTKTSDQHYCTIPNPDGK